MDVKQTEIKVADAKPIIKWNEIQGFVEEYVEWQRPAEVEWNLGVTELEDNSIYQPWLTLTSYRNSLHFLTQTKF